MVHRESVAYRSLRIGPGTRERESLGRLSPSKRRPTSLEALNLQADGHTSACATAHTARLTERTPHVPIRAFEQRGGAHPFREVSAARGRKQEWSHRRVAGGRRLWEPARASMRLGASRSWREQLVARLPVGIPTEVFAGVVRHMAQRLKEAAVSEHLSSRDLGSCCPQLAVVITADDVQPRFWP